MAETTKRDSEEGDVTQRAFEAPTGATTVTLVRHGQTVGYSEDQPFPMQDGQGDPPLTELGWEQARRAAERLAPRHPDVVVTSTLTRTQQSAAPLLEMLGMTAEPIADLREVHLGEWEGGRIRAEIAAGNPIVNEIMATGRFDKIPGAEPQDEFLDRIWRGVTTVVAANPGRHIVAYVHGGVVSGVMGRFTDGIPRTYFMVENASFSELVFMDSHNLLRSFNDTGHLVGL